MHSLRAIKSYNRKYVLNEMLKALAENMFMFPAQLFNKTVKVTGLIKL